MLVLPFKLCMTKEGAVEAFGGEESRLGAAVGELDDYLALALFLLNERERGDESFWAPYYAVLPSLQEVNPTFAWDESSLEALEGSPLLASTRSMQGKLTREWEALQSTIFPLAPEKFPEEAFNYDLFVWAFAMLFSRAVRIRSLERGETLALVPYADLINHSPFSNAFIDGRSPSGLDKVFNLKEDEVVLYADRSYKRMEQVVISYGQKSNAELLLLYGFALDRNPFNSVDVGVALLDKTAAENEEGLDDIDKQLLEAKRIFLDVRNRQDEAAFPVYADRYPEELLEYLRLLVLSSEDFAGALAQRQRLQEASVSDQLRRAATMLVEDTTKADEPARGGAATVTASRDSLAGMDAKAMALALGNIDFREYISRDNEEGALAALKSTAEAAVERYPTTEAQDQALMEDGFMFRTLPREVRMSIRHRRAEKSILRRTIAVVEKDLARMRS
uniref:Rubisco LSMT substrate-binding domain-containing protein n=2 Tax=Phaeomonas parva TaxID=124430 RepID=A0A7S1TNV7_9STRA|mmetsp:Transcript_10053/g.29804  ORF Transcript_10053/g.29804 Transcript_10053/m.29804 type:complete len:449 (+) Transcript_10053:208-1554(+)